MPTFTCGKPAHLSRNNCSISAESVLNLAGLAAQFRRRTQSAYDDISQASLVRLLFLATYLHPSTGKKGEAWLPLYTSKHAQMTKQDLYRLLNLSKSVTLKFIDEVSGKYLHIDDSGNVLINSRFFWRGRLIKGYFKQFSYTQLQYIYINKLQELYKTTSAKKHRYLGYVFRMLPYINIQYNLLCWNPDEQNLDEVKLMSIDEFCREIGYSTNQRQRLMNVYSDIKFLCEGKNQRFCSFVTDSKNKSETKIIINPHILYCGNDYRQVEVLGVFF